MSEEAECLCCRRRVGNRPGSPGRAPSSNPFPEPQTVAVAAAVPSAEGCGTQQVA